MPPKTNTGAHRRTQWQVHLSRLPPGVRTALLIDVGHRNLGLCVYDVKNDALVRLEWVDLARHPEAETPNGHEVAGEVVAYLMDMPERLTLDLCVIEQQPIVAQNESRFMNLIVQGAICGMCETAGLPYLLFDPGALKKSLCPHLFSKGEYADNKRRVRAICALTMRPRELLAVLVACARQRAFAVCFSKRYKGPGPEFEWDDIADAFFFALLMRMRLGDEAAIERRIARTGDEYRARVETVFEVARGAIPADMRYETEFVRYLDESFEIVLPHDGTAVPPELRYLEERLFPRLGDDEIGAILRGEELAGESRKRKLQSGDFRTTYRERKRGVSRKALNNKADSN